MRPSSLVFVATAAAPMLLLQLPIGAIAFATTTTSSRPSFFSVSGRHTGTSTTGLHAEGGAPQYERRNAKLRKAEMVADGTAMLHIDLDVDSKNNKEAVVLDYQPGHVLALEIETSSTEAGDELDDKTAKDAQSNGGWMRGPYTVSRATSDSIDIMIKVVGSKSKAFALSKPGTPLRFGGKFKVPIVDGVSDDAKRVVLISTGVGIGPCIGAIEKMIEMARSEQENGNSVPKVDLFASFRTEGDVPYREYLDGLAADNPGKFSWTPIVTSEVGRISSSKENLQMVVSSGDENDKTACSVTETHYHLIGNGQLVSEWEAGLLEAGVSEDMVTVEMYFNHKAEPSQEAIDRITNAVSSAAVLSQQVV